MQYSAAKTDEPTLVLAMNTRVTNVQWPCNLHYANITCVIIQVVTHCFLSVIFTLTRLEHIWNVIMTKFQDSKEQCNQKHSTAFCVTKCRFICGYWCHRNCYSLRSGSNKLVTEIALFVPFFILIRAILTPRDFTIPLWTGNRLVHNEKDQKKAW